MIVKMIQNLGNRIDKMQETVNKDVEELKRNYDTAACGKETTKTVS